jgi:hypothetical protein
MCEDHAGQSKMGFCDDGDDTLISITTGYFVWPAG